MTQVPRPPTTGHLSPTCGNLESLGDMGSLEELGSSLGSAKGYTWVGGRTLSPTV